MTIRFLMIFILTILPYVATTNELDDIMIDSDNLIIDKKNNLSTFKGNVILCFDNGIIIETDKIIITNTKNQETNKESFEKIIIPSKLRGIKNSTDQKTQKQSLTTLIADKATYILSESKLVLEGNIYMQENDNLIKCNQLVYLTKITKLSTSDSTQK